MDHQNVSSINLTETDSETSDNEQNSPEMFAGAAVCVLGLVVNIGAIFSICCMR